ncbi:MAG: N-acetylmuramoyl-L-alanine amidase, partial [Muribaculaceae bacterium]|nr:N-acetylmuramoyl-L-alanine amidase [Muribaculaceae bacterium]
MILNNKRKVLMPSWYFRIKKPLVFGAILLLSLLCQQIAAKTVADSEPFVLIIDPGHGGKDHGAAENGVKEKDINLAVAKYLAKLLEKKKDNIKVIMTRDKDNFITLQRRADIANENKGNLFISIHTNSVDKSNKNRKNISGSSVYTLGLNKDENNMKVAQRENSVIELENDYSHKYSGFDPTKDESYIIFQMAQKKDLIQSIKFAEQTQNKLVSKAHRGNRGVHQAGFWVLWATSMPAVLVELDFICNPTAAK